MIWHLFLGDLRKSENLSEIKPPLNNSTSEYFSKGKTYKGECNTKIEAAADLDLKFHRIISQHASYIKREKNQSHSHRCAYVFLYTKHNKKPHIFLVCEVFYFSYV